MTNGDAAPPASRLRSARDSAPPVPAGSALVLVVDGDAVTRRFVELVLAPERRLQVEAVATAAAALDLMRITACDLIVTEARLPDLDGLDLIRRLRGRARGRGPELPIVVLSADDRVETKVAAFAAGADDFLQKPCAGAELRARVTRRLLQHGVERARQHAAGALLAGQLSAMPLPDLVGVLAMGRRSATVDIHTPRGDGRLCFQDGRMVHATFLTLSGARAFYHLFAEESGAFHLTDGCAAREHTINDSVTALIMEAARLLDTGRATGIIPVIPAPGTATATAALPTSLHRPTPDRHLALGFTRDVTDPYTMATLELMTTRDLGDWSRRATPGPRLQVAVVAPALTGAAALASMSTVPGERELAAAIDREPRCLVAQVLGRDARAIDLVLVELAHGTPFVRALGRRPDLVILAGPEGDLVQAWSQYLDHLALLAPTTLVSVGDRGFDDAITSLFAGAAAPTARVHRAADLGQPGELRRALAEGLRLWLSGGR